MLLSTSLTIFGADCGACSSNSRNFVFLNIGIVRANIRTRVLAISNAVSATASTFHALCYWYCARCYLREYHMEILFVANDNS